jgi:type I restriction enzyme S subunit
MQDLLTKGIDENGNIRDEKTHKFKDSPLGRIPEEWEVVRLGEVGELRKEKALPPKNNIYIGLENIEKGTGKINGFIPSDEVKGISNIFKTGDILFGKLRPNLRKFWYAKYNGYCSTEFLVIFPSNEKIIKEFLYLVIGSNNFLKLAESKVFGTKMPRTSWDILKNYTFSLPPLPEQQRIAEILSQIDQTIEKEQQYKEKLQRIKQGLMQDLLTGKVRVNHLVEEKEDEQRYTSNFTRT